ncbi:SMP-30/gluconolactonase/LRE family protein [Phytohabitans kaempferiae]|uniref:SMP-30/gluconolactonase/LRE family protein n=1 Tax=Phytohabitans kaempferiae TaxID=1620943 RepID=A0ABV6M6I6_9ACTN
MLVDCRAEVGEGPLYDAARHLLYWVDIPRGRLWRSDLATGEVTSRDIGEPLGSVALVEGGALLLATRSGIRVLPRWPDGTTGEPALWRAVEPDLPTQFNDGKCDAQGRFVAGTAASSPDRPHQGTLYRVDQDGAVVPLFGGIGMSNGLDWSPDDRYFYHVDTLAGLVTRHRWDPEVGVPSHPEPFVQVPRSEGLPDGLSVDAEGFLWLALWGGGQVRRYDPAGRLDRVVGLPTPNVTSCVFGGPDLTDLYVTTAAHGQDASDRLAGAVFVADVGVPGQPRPAFLNGAVSRVTALSTGLLTVDEPNHHP